MSLRTSNQLRAARALAGLSQEALAERAGLHVNSIRYLERQGSITTGHSSGLVRDALKASGVEVFCNPIGVRLAPVVGE